MNRIYFSQADNRWANHPYPSSKYPKATKIWLKRENNNIHKRCS